MSNRVINPELATPKPTVTHTPPKGNTPAAPTQKGLSTTTNTRAGTGYQNSWLTDSEPPSRPIKGGGLSG